SENTMANELIENHKRYLERIALYRQYGYDIDEERNYVIEKACPFSGNILEAGTGKGYFSLALARLGFHFTTFDISATEQWYAGLNLAYHGLAGYVRFDVADLERLPYPDDSYDVIFAVNIIHHLASVEPAVNELIRVLSPSGKIVLSDFNEKGLAVLDQIHALDGRKHELGAATLREAKAVLIRHGLRIEEHRGAHQNVLVACRMLM
ncbi:MAG: class I SAM-dependent methyltransferase, partial [Smithella sp.]